MFRSGGARGEVERGEVSYVGDAYGCGGLGARGGGITPVLIDREGTAPAVDCMVVASLLELLGLIDA